jgi:ATP-dependent Clp protease, protease subunit
MGAPAGKLYGKKGAIAFRLRQSMRRVYLFGDVCNERAEKFIAQLHEMFDEGVEPITIYINSVGGSVTDALAIYDVLQNAPCEIHTVGLGKVHSAAVTVLLSAPRANRASYPNTEFMSHDISWKSDGPRAFLKDRVDQLERTVNQLLRVYTRDTKLSAEQARMMFFTDLADHYFTAAEALEMGVVSRIISRDPAQVTTGARAELRLIEPIGAVTADASAVNSSQE